eukprot:2144692-Alexandrium_andersonii.AAC.1
MVGLDGPDDADLDPLDEHALDGVDIPFAAAAPVISVEDSAPLLERGGSDTRTGGARASPTDSPLLSHLRHGAQPPARDQ